MKLWLKSMRKNYLLAFCTVMACYNVLVQATLQFGEFDNKGILSLKDSSLRIQRVFNNLGQVLGEGTIDCVCGTLSGNGLFKVHSIKIIAKEFQFTGVIECEGECLIITAQPFDHSICTLKGNGTFTFIVDEYAYDEKFVQTNKPEELHDYVAPVYSKTVNVQAETQGLQTVTYSKEQLIQAFEKYIDQRIFLITRAQAEDFIEKIRCHAREGNLNEKEIIKELGNKLQLRIALHRNELESKKGIIHAALGGLGCALGMRAGKFCWDTFGVPDFQDGTITLKDFSYMISLTAVLIGGAVIERGLKHNLNNKAKYAQLLMVEEVLEK
jgi:hypothetical protein